MYISFFILRPRVSEGGISPAESEPMCAGVTVRSKLDERDLADIFSYRTVCVSLSIRYLPIFFLVGQSSPAKFPLWSFLRFLPGEWFITT
jgi:hypothetical protein